jgi:pectate lyase
MALAVRVSLVALAVLSASTTSCTRLRELAGARDAADDPGPGAVSAGAEGPVNPVTPVRVAMPSSAGGGGLPAFPGAEGFGASTKGGRGGPACHVRTLAHAGAGSLQACLDATGPRIVVFDVSGVIEGPLEIKHGRLTIAGQTSPNGITVKGGIVCDNVYDPNDCNDLVIRHVRLRAGAPDSLRLGGAHDVIVDHCSLATAEDENLEITRSRNITVQHSIVAEPSGDHYQWGGVLINYSKDVMPLDRITIHHTVWNGVAGRLPEISCEENGDGPGKSNCAGHVLSIELANNVLWDASDPIWFNHCTGNNQGNDCPATAATFALTMNLVGNVMARRASADADAPLAEPSVYAHRGGAVYSADNMLIRGAGPAKAANGPGTKIGARHAFPAVTYTPASALVGTLAKSAGAWPRDAMDERLSSYLTHAVDARPAAWRNGSGVDAGDALRARGGSASPPVDTDGDGMPDAWETSHGLDPRVSDGAVLGRARGCAAGYAALECYVNELADSRVPR